MILLRPLWLRERSLGESVTVAEVEKGKTTLHTIESQVNANFPWLSQSLGIVKAAWRTDQGGTEHTLTCQMSANGPLPRREQEQKGKDDIPEMVGLKRRRNQRQDYIQTRQTANWGWR